MKKITPLDYQVPHINNMENIIKKYGICIDNSRVGAGKMYTALLFAKKNNYHVYIITEKNVVIQWKDLCKKMNVTVVDIINFRKIHSTHHHKYAKGGLVTHETVSKTIIGHTSIHKVLLIIDEVHIARKLDTNAFTSIYEILYKCNVYSQKHRVANPIINVQIHGDAKPIYVEAIHVLLTSATIQNKKTVIPWRLCVKNKNNYNWISDRNKYLSNIINTSKQNKVMKICYLNLFMFAFNHMKYFDDSYNLENIIITMNSTFEKNTIHRITKINIEPDIYNGVTLICPLIKTIIRNINDNRGVLVIYNTEFVKYVLNFVISTNYVHNCIRDIYKEETKEEFQIDEYYKTIPKDCMDVIFSFIGTYDLRAKLAIRIGRCAYNSLNGLKIKHNFYKKQPPRELTPNSDYIVDIIVNNLNNIVNIANTFTYEKYKLVIITILQIMKQVTYGNNTRMTHGYDTTTHRYYRAIAGELLDDIINNDIIKERNKIDKNFKKLYNDKVIEEVMKANILHKQNIIIEEEYKKELFNNINIKYNINIDVEEYILNTGHIRIDKNHWGGNNNRIRYNPIDRFIPYNKYFNDQVKRNNLNPTRLHMSNMYIEYQIYENFVKNNYDISFQTFNLLYRCVDTCVKHNGNIIESVNNLFNVDSNTLTIIFAPVAYFEIKYGITENIAFIKSFNVSKNNESKRIKKYFYKTYKDIITYREQMRSMVKINYATIGYNKQTNKKKEKLFKNFRDGNINLLISNAKNLSMGVNLHDVENKMPKTYIVIPDKDIATSVQAAGRVARAQSKTNPIIESLLRYSLDNKKCYDNKLLKKIKEINVSNKFEFM